MIWCYMSKCACEHFLNKIKVKMKAIQHKSQPVKSFSKSSKFIQRRVVLMKIIIIIIGVIDAWHHVNVFR